LESRTEFKKSAAQNTGADVSRGGLAVQYRGVS
jgi:hypothetical protein